MASAILVRLTPDQDEEGGLRKACSTPETYIILFSFIENNNAGKLSVHRHHSISIPLFLSVVFYSIHALL